MPDYPISETGVFVNEAGEVVEEVPVEGTQLVAPGGFITPDAQKAIDAARSDAPGGEVVGDTPAPEAPKRGRKG